MKGTSGPQCSVQQPEDNQLLRSSRLLNLSLQTHTQAQRLCRPLSPRNCSLNTLNGKALPSFSLSLVHSPIPFSHSLSPLSPFSQLWCQLCAPVTSSSACHGRLWAFSLVHILTLTLALDTLLLSLQEQAAATAALYGSLPYILTHYLTNLAGECCTGKSPLLRTN